MLPILVKTLPFFMLIGLGYWAGRARFFSPEATAYLTKFVFYFALSAMIFRFAANLELSEIWDARFASAYLLASLAIYALAFVTARLRRQSLPEAAVEAQCAVVGNTGFLGIPMLVVLLGEASAGPILLVLAIDLIVFSSLITLIMAWSREGRGGLAAMMAMARGLAANPMIMSMCLGLVWSSFALPVPGPINEFLAILGAAATPGALFAIGASLATKAAVRPEVAAWLSLCKLVLHPAAVAFAAYGLFAVDPDRAAVMVAAAALPVAGNVYILAQHYGVAPQRVSASILFSTVASILTVSFIIARVTGAGS